jgi:secondary thiamine-phosphate synthase enzyme
VKTETFDLETGEQASVVDITQQVMEFVRGEADGLVNVFAPHATCGVALIEVGAGSDHDLITAIDDVLPKDDRWTHRHGSYGHGRDHVMPAFVSPSISIPVVGGMLQLGTWQSVVLVDPNVDNPHRQFRLSWIAG